MKGSKYQVARRTRAAIEETREAEAAEAAEHELPHASIIVKVRRVVVVTVAATLSIFFYFVYVGTWFRQQGGY